MIRGTTFRSGLFSIEPATKAWIFLFVFIARPVWPQDPEAGVTQLDKTERVLRIDAYRPLDSAAQILASDYQIDISAEDSPFSCSKDVTDIHPSRKNALAAEHFYLPKGSNFQVRFSVDRLRYPLNIRGLLADVVAACNQSSAFQYRLQENGDFYSFVPIAARDARCRSIGITALLDHRISIPATTMEIYRAIAVIESALSAQVGEYVHVNTQDWLNRIPDFELSLSRGPAPARDFLLAIIKATHYRFYWLVREQPYRRGWVINMIPLTRRVVKESGGGFHYPWVLWPGQKPLPPAPPPPAPRLKLRRTP